MIYADAFLVGAVAFIVISVVLLGSLPACDCDACVQTALMTVEPQTLGHAICESAGERESDIERAGR